MSSSPSSRAVGIGRVLIVVYAILALAATGRSFVQIVTKFDTAPVAYSLSALAAVVYIVATIALIRSGSGWYRVAWVTITFDPVLFPKDTVWSYFGRGYLFIPLVLPVLGMVWLRSRRVVAVEAAA
jgi:hypothetical protein